MPIAELGHVGVRVDDLDLMRTFYTEMTQQVSFRIDSVELLLDFHQRFKAAGVRVQQEVTHCNAYGIYFWDPEGNRIEVYYRVPIDLRQPFREDLKLDQPLPDVLAEAERLPAEGGPAYTGAVGGATDGGSGGSGAGQ